MKTETRLPHHKFGQLGAPPKEPDSATAAMSPQCRAEKIATVVAAASSDLRSSSEQTTEIMKRMLLARCTTAELVAWSRAAIDSSRCLLKTKIHRAGPALDRLEPRQHGANPVRSEN